MGLLFSTVALSQRLQFTRLPLQHRRLIFRCLARDAETHIRAQSYYLG
jgi:hypothetical protein